MGSVNKVLLVGNLGLDAEVRYTPGGAPVASFSIATTENWTSKDGEKHEQTEWHRIVLWGKQAETLQPYLTKGKQIYVEGRLQTRQWEKDGQKHYTTEIKADRIVLLGGGEAWYRDERLPGAEALRRAGLAPVALSYKEGLALNNGTAQMLATGVLALAKLESLLATADLAAAMTIDAFAGRLGAFAEEVHALRPHPGQVAAAAHVRALLEGSTLAGVAYHLVPKFRHWSPGAWTDPALQPLRFDH